MNEDDRGLSRVLGFAAGIAIGDAVGCPFERCDANYIKTHLGGRDWIDEMYPYPDDRMLVPYAVWVKHAPRGTGGDDTRDFLCFCESVIRNGGSLTPVQLAEALVDRHEHAEKYYPGFGELAKDNWSGFYGVACGFLDKPCYFLPGVPPDVLRACGIERADFPTLDGLLLLGAAGFLYPGEPERAYKEAYRLCFVEMGYGKEAVAIYSALVSLMVGQDRPFGEMLDEVLRLNPYRLGTRWFPSKIAGGLPGVLERCLAAKDDRDLVNRLSREFMSYHHWDPYEAIACAAATILYAKGDPRRTILLAVNERDIDAAGNLVRFRDNDCTASIAGGLVGALRGIEAFPQDWVRAAFDANKRVYGIDIEKVACEFWASIQGRRRRG